MSTREDEIVAACEECWAEANWQVMVLGGSVVARYQKLIAGPGHKPDPEREDETK